MPTYEQIKENEELLNHFTEVFASFMNGSIQLNDSNKITIKNMTFYIIEDFMLNYDNYYLLFGFYLLPEVNVGDHLQLKKRFFYLSNSSGMWRVGTRLQKGTFDKGKKDGGYIHETQLHYKLNEKLNAVKMQIIEYHQNRIIEDNTFYDNSVLENSAVYSGCGIYFASEDFFKSYCTEITYQLSGIEETTFDDFLEIQDITGTTLYGNSSSDLNHYSKEAIARIKKNYDLWDKLALFLSQEPDKEYSFKHDFLNHVLRVEAEQQTNVLRYTLDQGSYQVLVDGINLVLNLNLKISIEFAVFLCDQVISKRDGTEVTSPLVWIKSVYCPNTVTSFGNYGVFPADLSFLTQKPFDYVSQMILGRDLNVKYANPLPPILIDENGVDRTRYAYLTAHNEKTNMLVRIFKNKKGFSNIYAPYSISKYKHREQWTTPFRFRCLSCRSLDVNRPGHRHHCRACGRGVFCNTCIIDLENREHYHYKHGTLVCNACFVTIPQRVVL